MADTPKIPDPVPGSFVWFGRFKNRAGIITKVWKEGETLKVEIEPVPKGRKKPKTRNMLPYRMMDEEDSARFKKVYDEETKKLREKSAKVAERYQKVKAAEFEEDEGWRRDAGWSFKEALREIRLAKREDT